MKVITKNNFEMNELLNNNPIKKQNVINKILLQSNGSIIPITLDNIDYLKASGCYTEIFTIKKDKFISSKPLGYYEKILYTFGFIRIHQKYIVNSYNITGIRRTEKKLKVILTSGTELPVTRLKKSDLLKMFIV